MIDGKLTAVTELDDGRFAYSRGQKKPAAILTGQQLEEVQRLNSIRLLLPFSFLVLGGVIIFVLAKDDMLLPASVAVGVIALAVSTYVIIAMAKRIAVILDVAPSIGALPVRIPPSAFFVNPLPFGSNLHVLMGKWFWGCMCIASIVVPLAKYLKSKKIAWPDTLGMFAFAIASYVLFRAFSAERRRRKIAASADKA